VTIGAVESAGARFRADEESAPIGTRRLLFITFHFPPSVEVGAYSCAQIARYLPRYGWEPIVLAATERNYEFADPRVEPTARVIRTLAIPNPLGVYRSLRSRRPHAAAAPLAIDGSPAANGRRRKLAASLVALLDTPDMYLGWLAPAVLSGLRACRRLRIHHLLSSGPCWTNHLVGLILARRTRLPWTVHFRDPWVRDLDERAPAGAAHRISAALEKAVVTRAQSVVCVTSRHTTLLRQRYPHLPAEKFFTVPNGYDEAEWKGVDEEAGGRAVGTPSRFVITHAGTVYDGRTPEPLFRALRGLIDRGDVDVTRLQIDLIGWWEPGQRESIEAMAARWGLGQSVRLYGPLTKVETFRRFAASSLLLLLAERWVFQVPAKAYEYLRAGRPVLALAPSDGAVTDLFQATGGAWVVDHTDETAITAAVGEAYRDWSLGRPLRTADRGAVARFDRARLAADFAAVLAAAGSRASRMKRRECEWLAYVVDEYGLAEFPPGACVLDLGCGGGLQLANLESHGALAIGLDPWRPSLEECRRKRLRVMQGRAEQIPMKEASVDGVLFKVVVPYTEEARVFGEVSRVLKKGALAYCTYHGAGYYLRYALYPHYWKYRVYGVRALVNTWWYALTGLTLPGFLGDTLYQSHRRLAKYYQQSHLELVAETPARTFLGFPVFIYHALRKVGP